MVVFGYYCRRFKHFLLEICRLMVSVIPIFPRAPAFYRERLGTMKAHPKQTIPHKIQDFMKRGGGRFVSRRESLCIRDLT